LNRDQVTRDECRWGGRKVHRGRHGQRRSKKTIGKNVRTLL
jgi:hypothetical protein